MKPPVELYSTIPRIRHEALRRMKSYSEAEVTKIAAPLSSKQGFFSRIRKELKWL